MNGEKQDRMLEIFFRGLRGEDLYIRKLAREYGVSGKSISRDVSDLQNFLAEHRELVGHAELRYDRQQRCYRLHMEEFLSNKELFALVEVLIGARAFSKEELLVLVAKLKRRTTTEDRPRLQRLIQKEMRHYAEVRHDCESVQDNLWQLIVCIEEKREISIDYYHMSRVFEVIRLRPASVMFTDFYFYLIAFKVDDKEQNPVYFRVDRIKHITEHRAPSIDTDYPEFDEGLLRKRSLLMWPGKLRTIRFEFSGPSLQAVLDKLPTAIVIERMRGGKYLIEAEVYGSGIRMWLLSQGSWVKVIAPEEFVEEMRGEIERMRALYQSDDTEDNAEGTEEPLDNVED